MSNSPRAKAKGNLILKTHDRNTMDRRTDYLATLREADRRSCCVNGSADKMSCRGSPPASTSPKVLTRRLSVSLFWCFVSFFFSLERPLRWMWTKDCEFWKEHLDATFVWMRRKHWRQQLCWRKTRIGLTSQREGRPTQTGASRQQCLHRS